jgi:hypothetical protein
MTTPTEPSPEAQAEFVARVGTALVEAFETSMVEMAKDPLAAAYLAGLTEGVLKIEMARGRFRVVPLDDEPEEPADDELPGFYL